MYSFLNDYSEGAHPLVLDALIQTNNEQTVGYGLDPYCQKAKEVILKRINNQNADVHFLVGGTQTNAIFISFVLKDYQAVIACDEGHINVHETGAIENTGHKVLTRPHKDGKLTVAMIQSLLDEHTDEHMVQPAMVYISQTTELGTYYTKQELEDIYTFTKKNGLYLFLDGARLGSALVLEDAPSMEDIASHTDAFYIGGTKMGAMFGEALVIINDDLKKDFRFQLKQKGAMLAKGRLLGVQFYTLLKDDLYENIGEHENKMADLIRDALKQKKCDLICPSQTNQIFVALPIGYLFEIQSKFMITVFKKIDENRVIARFVTSWATQEEAVLKLVKCIENL
ncbi:MAG: aminotransferase class I/II-fold pyridoxal phosphate-dependent enzyme [Coprobacillus sp.]